MAMEYEYDYDDMAMEEMDELLASRERIDMTVNPLDDDGIYKRGHYSPIDNAMQSSQSAPWGLKEYGLSMD